MSRFINDDNEAPRATALEARRAFLAKVGRAALAVPPATSLILAAATKPANAKSRYGKTKEKKKKKKKKKKDKMPGPGPVHH
jgi:hypothetical protein